MLAELAAANAAFAVIKQAVSNGKETVSYTHLTLPTIREV